MQAFYSVWSPERRTLPAAVSGGQLENPDVTSHFKLARGLHSICHQAVLLHRVKGWDRGIGFQVSLLKLLPWVDPTILIPEWNTERDREPRKIRLSLCTAFIMRTSGRLTLVATLAVHLSRMAGVTWHKLAGHSHYTLQLEDTVQSAHFFHLTLYFSQNMRRDY